VTLDTDFGGLKIPVLQLGGQYRPTSTIKDLRNESNRYSDDSPITPACLRNECLDAGTARAAPSGNTSVEAVGAINGTKDDRG
jgi:hypothetical protein